MSFHLVGLLENSGKLVSLQSGLGNRVPNLILLFVCDPGDPNVIEKRVKPWCWT